MPASCGALYQTQQLKAVYDGAVSQLDLLSSITSRDAWGRVLTLGQDKDEWAS